MAKKAMLVTTADNPFSPFTQFDSWFMYDMRMGYNTFFLLANLAPLSDNLTDYENDVLASQAINELLDMGIAIGRDGAVSKYVPAIEDETAEW